MSERYGNRPVVVVERGAVTFTYPGFGHPLVLDLDELGVSRVEVVRLVVRTEDGQARVVEGPFYDSLLKALRGYGTTTTAIDMEGQNGSLGTFTLREEDPLWEEE